MKGKKTNTDVIINKRKFATWAQKQEQKASPGQVQVKLEAISRETYLANRVPAYTNLLPRK